MAERTVKVSLVANVNGYIDGMNRAARATRDLSNDAQAKLAAQREAFGAVGRSALAVGVLAVAGVAIAIKKFAEFDQAMSSVAAVTQETTDNMQLLRAAALDAGGRTIFTATEAANAIEQLGKAGLSTADILGGALEGALSLAATEQMDVARAAEITATTLKQYGLAGTDAAHVADVLAAAAGKALGSAEDLAQGLKFVGPVAASMGVSLEETAGALALFADQGLIGEQAGTSLRGVLASLTSPSHQAGVELQYLGVQLYDTKGNFAGLANVAQQLSLAYSDMTDEQRDASLGLIFGNAQVTAARVLFAAGGEAVRKYTDEVNDAGYAARVAADRMDNLRGDLEKLGGAFDTALIQTGTGANDVLRQLTQSATFLVDQVGGLPAPVLAAGLAVGVFTAALALSSGAALIAVPRFLQARQQLAALGITARTTAVAVGTSAAAFTAATLIIGYFISRQADVAATADSITESLDQTSGALTKYSRELIAKKLAEGGAFEGAREAGISQTELTDAVIAGGEALKDVQAKIGANNTIGTFFTGVGIRAGNASQTIREVSSALETSTKNFQDTKSATDESARSDQAKAGALAEIAGAAGMASDEVKGLADQIRGFADFTLSSRDAARQFQAAIDEATASFEENGKTLNIHTAAGRENQAALDAIAKAAKEAAAAKYEQTGSESAAAKAIDAGRSALIEQLKAFGITGDKAQEYADNLGLIPDNVRTVVALSTSGAQEDLDRFITLNNGRKVRVNVGPVNGPGFASGGFTGPGAKYTPVGTVHAGEYVVRREQTAIPANRAALEYMNAGGVMRGYASGGLVAPAAAAASISIAVTVQAGYITDRDSIGPLAVAAIREGLSNGSIPTDWNAPR
jgi:TP901 family phage tail tape measure protein